VKASYRKPVRITQPGLHTASRSPSGWQSKCCTGKGQLEYSKRNSKGRRFNQHQRICFLKCSSSKCREGTVCADVRCGSSTDIDTQQTRYLIYSPHSDTGICGRKYYNLLFCCRKLLSTISYSLRCCTWQHTTHTLQTSKSPAGFESAIPGSERLQTYTLARADTENGAKKLCVCKL